jgi:hypothetical protein
MKEYGTVETVLRIINLALCERQWSVSGSGQHISRKRERYTPGTMLRGIQNLSWRDSKNTT